MITAATRLVPAGYHTTLQLVTADHCFHGFTIAAPKHEWPFYASGPGWHLTPITAASEVVAVMRADFTGGLVEEAVTEHTILAVDPAVDGDKVLPIPAFSGGTSAMLRWRYRMGAGLGALELGCEPAPVKREVPTSSPRLALGVSAAERSAPKGAAWAADA